MIVDGNGFQSLPAREIAMVDGCFDPLHWGHLKYFEEAQKLGYRLFCNVQADAYLWETKRRPTILPEEQRAYLLSSLRTIDYVHICKTSTAEVLDTLRPAVYIKGADWKGRGLPEKEQAICKKHGIKIEYLDTMFDSSTNRTKEFVSKSLQREADMNLQDFEKLVLEQKHVEAQQYSDNYFMDEWRKGQNDYTIETRRKIEGKNPQNIKEIFSPKRVLDLGCGPGALMYLLNEIGVEAYGVDFSAPAKELAPKEIRDRIHVGSVLDYHDFGVEFDLVICREVLEHLTVLEVKRAVANMARLSSRYVYVTTRFHPTPQSLLDVTTDFETDPTHITCMNKDLLRVFFVLEGMKRREDLEQKLDWKNYGRVLVYEKVNA